MRSLCGTKSRTGSVPSSGGAIHCDDAVLLDNNETVIDDGWTIKRRGLVYLVDHPGQFSFSIATAEAEQGGWWVAEASPARVRFGSAGKPSALTVYPDGRAYCDGEFKSLVTGMKDAAELTRQNESPAQIAVPANLGRVNRSTPGDANNDGYNETAGAYELVAAGPRLEFTLTPQTSVLARPVIEISNLPPGTALINMEGQLVEGSKRLPNGNLLIELPARLERTTLVNVRVQ